jgi:predicted restriction endonuclease
MVSKLETYLDKYDNKQLYETIYTQYLDFDYDNEELYKLHLDFMLKNLYNITIIKYNKKRLGQVEFRKQLLKKFNNKCIVTNETCNDELTAAHIIPISKEENYDIDNGLLLSETLHRTFDKYKWSINPDTQTIVIDNNQNVGSIKKYENQKICLLMNDRLYNNIIQHYTTFLKKLKINK